MFSHFIDNTVSNVKYMYIGLATSRLFSTDSHDKDFTV